MASLQQIKLRLKAVKNVGQITKAMEVVATTKMRRSQEVALGSRPYAHKILELLNRLAEHAPLKTPLTETRDVHTTMVVLMTSDRGLIGSFNAQAFRFADGFFSEDEYKDAKEHAYKVITIGKKAMLYAQKKGLNIVKSFHGFGDYVAPSEVDDVTSLLTEGFLEKEWDRVITISTHFRTTLKQEVLQREVLPVSVKKVREALDAIIPEYGRFAELSGRTAQLLSGETAKSADGLRPVRPGPMAYGEPSDLYIFEPGPEEALEAIIPHLVKMQLYHLVLEANASEHSARRVAMKTASDNASELSGSLTLEYNKARQASITKEIIEITSTQNALI